MAEWVYVDNSNLFIEARRVSAIKNGMAHDIADAIKNKIFDSDYRISFGKLYRFITGSYQAETSRAIIFGSGGLENEAIRGLAEQAGFEVKVHSRNLANREKKVDTDIVTEMVRDAYKNANVGDTFNLVAGDKDYVPPVERLISDGMKVDVIFWDHAAGELKDACSNFISLNEHLEVLKPRVRDNQEDIVQTA